jgi:(2Fe-2S) ferredoxin
MASRRRLFDSLGEKFKAAGIQEGELRVKRSRVSCFAACKGGPILCVQPDGVWYYNVTPENMDRIVAQHLVGGQAAKLRRRLGFAGTAGQRRTHVPRSTQIIEERVKSILSSNDSPDISFDLSINPYRGCEHGCVYCFARPTHSYLNMSPGLDFETRIIAKVNAAERLREAFASRSYEPLLLNIGSATDAYQPVERKLRHHALGDRGAAECAHPFSLVSKSSGVERDLDLIAPMAAQGLVAVYISVTSLDAGCRASWSRAPPRRSAACARSRRWPRRACRWA